MNQMDDSEWAFQILSNEWSFWLAECFLGAVSHVQEAISFLESIVQRIHATSCKIKRGFNYLLMDCFIRKWFIIAAACLPVWGSVFCTKTNRDLDGSNCSLSLSMWMKCPTVMSRGTKYLNTSKCDH